MSGVVARRQETVTGPAGELFVDIWDGPSGPPAVLFVHPVNTAGAVWDEVAATLSSARSCLVPDLRGHGRSVYRGPFRVEDHVADLFAVMDGLGVESVHVVGASLGGPIAVAMAAAQPTRIRSIAAFGSALALSMSQPALDEVRDLLTTLGTSAFLQRVVPAALGSAARDRLAASTVQLAIGSRPRDPSMVWEIVDATFHSDVTSLAGTVRASSLVVTGDEDGTGTAAASEEMARALRAAPAVVLPGVGHLPMLEVPSTVADLLQRHFARTEIGDV